MDSEHFPSGKFGTIPTEVWFVLWYGVEARETSNVNEIECVMTRHTRLVWNESPTNRLLRITDIRAAFASPFFQRVCRSASKISKISSSIWNPL